LATIAMGNMGSGISTAAISSGVVLRRDRVAGLGVDGAWVMAQMSPAMQ